MFLDKAALDRLLVDLLLAQGQDFILSLPVSGLLAIINDVSVRLLPNFPRKRG